ncbi:MAG: hypothetical protein KW804_01895 [Candidatus Doudnabacteria bacterium]|nr:hypothetical protein [Candidatus Doudnabacteria bacterium]
MAAQKVENWEFFQREIPPPQGRYGAPELWRTVLLFKGLVNGVKVELPVDKKGGEKFVSNGNEYELGDPHPNYEKAFPNAKTRILAVLHVAATDDRQ